MKKVTRNQLAKAFVALVNQQNYSGLLNELAQELVVSHRVSEMDLLVRDINRELLRQKRHLETTVTSVHSLEDNIVKAVERQLMHQTGAETVGAVFRQDPNLVGGLVAETPDELIDFSLKFKLEQLEV